MKSRRQWMHQRKSENENNININIKGNIVTLKSFIVITGNMKYFRSQYSDNKVKGGRLTKIGMKSLCFDATSHR